MINKLLKKILQFFFTILTTFKPNNFHPLVWVTGDPIYGKNVHIGAFSELSCKNSKITIGDNVDIAAFVSINCADSHLRTIGKKELIERNPIIIGNNVFIGSHSVIKGGAIIGDNTVIAAGAIVDAKTIPPFSLVYGNPMVVKKGYYENNK